MEFVPIMIASFVLALALTPVARRLAFRFGVIDQPSSRKVHTSATPLMGGFAIYGGLVLALLIFAPYAHQAEMTATSWASSSSCWPRPWRRGA